ncbi:MAG TPA: hypothetical protein PKA00_22215 [Saprospiraceae bacterium]|nr:hypothetical protein [Saprospiraceae bacterium]HMQ85644.1 hypothetical protein [Saprospiraceae bacterium]
MDIFSLKSFLLYAVLFQQSSFQQVTVSDAFQQPERLLNCGEVFYDTGGPFGYYNDGESYTTTFCADNPDQFLEVQFASFSTEACCDYLYVYNGSSINDPFIGVYSGGNAPGTVASGQPGGCLTFHFYSDGSVIAPGWEAFINCVDCPAPNAIYLDYFDTNNAVLSCTNLDAALEYLWEIGPAGYEPGTAPVAAVSTNQNTVSIADLESSTNYEAYVRIVCPSGDTSQFTGPIAFRTYAVCGDPFYDPGGPTGVHGAMGETITVICPEVPGEFVNIEFESFNVVQDLAYLYIYNGNTPFSNFLGAFTGSELPGSFVSNHQSGCLAFVFNSFSDGNAPGWEASTSCITCPYSNALTLSFAEATLAEFYWEYVPSAMAYLWEIGPSGYVPGVDEALFSGTTPNVFASVGNLQSGTNYDVYVRSLCGPGDTSAYSSVLSFSTLPSCGDVFYDSGGSTGNYSEFEFQGMLLCPDEPGTFVSLTFNSFETEASDFMTIYNGYYGAIIGTYSGMDSPGMVYSTDPSGCLTLTFNNYDFGTAPGWEAEISCTDCVSPQFVQTDFISASLASFSWEPTSINFFEWEIGWPGFVPGSGEALFSGASAGSILNVGNLQSNTAYELYIRANCGAGNFGTYTGPVAFKTSPTCGDTFYDSGGPDENFQPFENQRVLICPDEIGLYAQVTFQEFVLDYAYMTVYDGESEADSFLGYFSGNQVPGVFTSSHPTGCLTFIFNAFSDITSAGWEATVDCIRCIRPANVVFSNITTTSVQMTWPFILSAELYHWEIGLPGFTPGTGNEVLAGDTDEITVLVEGLASGTFYEVYVQSDCGQGDESDFAGPFSFSTQITCGGAYYDSGGPNGFYQDNENRIEVICPSASGQSIEVTFQSFQTESCCDYMWVYNGDNTAAPLLGTYSGGTLPGPFLSTDPSGCLTFQFYSDGSVVSDGWEATVECRGCTLTENFQASNIGSEDVTLSWSESESAISFNWEIGLPGFIPGIGQAIQVGNSTENTILIENLQPNTAYQAYVRSVCDGFETGDYQGPIAFSTLVSGTFDPSQRAFEFQLSPNPSQGWVDVLFDQPIAEEVEIRLIDATGRVLLSQTAALAVGTRRIPLDLTALPVGVYGVMVKERLSAGVKWVVRE